MSATNFTFHNGAKRRNAQAISNSSEAYCAPCQVAKSSPEIVQPTYPKHMPVRPQVKMVPLRAQSVVPNGTKSELE